MKKGLLALIAIVLFMGCAKTPSLNYNASMHKDIRSIAIVAPQKTADLTVYYYNHPGENFGLVGGLVAAAEFDAKTKEYNLLLQKTGFRADAYFLNRLTKYLKAEGYKVMLIASDDKRKSEHMKVYPEANVDAYLDLVVYNVGYIAESPSATYKPTARLAARLVKKRNKEIVYEKHLAVGENFAIAKEVDYLGCEDKDCHADFDTLKNNALKSVEGLKRALDKVARRLASSLKKN